MDNRCTVCNHPSLPEIDRALLVGASLRPLAAQYGLSPSALSRHLKHLRRQLTAEQRRADQADAVAFLDKLDLLENRLDRLFVKSEGAHALHISLGCIQESLRVLALRAKIRHSLAGLP